MPAYDSRKPKCIGCSEALEENRRKQEARVGPRPWIGRKLAVGIAIALICYTYYVYVARFCVPMIKRESRALAGRDTGIALLVIFNVLFLIFGWTYVKVVFTSPGYAKDVFSMLKHLRGSPYIARPPTSLSQSRRSIDITSFSNGNASPRSPSPSRSPTHSRRGTYDSAINMTQTRHTSPRRTASTDIGPRDAILPAFSRAADNIYRDPTPPAPARILPSSNDSASGLPPLMYSRRPPTHPSLLPEYRYCERDGLVKPMRAHHCRACGTCVLKYDHHCPWIGQCVGAYNQKFFINFLLWAALFAAFILSTLIAFNARIATSSSPPSIDPEHIVIIALSGLFMFFTGALFMTQVSLVLFNTTTVEHMGMERMRARELSGLSEGHSYNVLVARRKIVKRWDGEWGRIDTEGNLWWLGSKRANWEATMGRNKWGWILPIGRSLGDGLTYPTNPRFDHDGRWRRRSEWPDGLR
ncbi:zf-DHHC-domain-containing protein [Ramaria rubella]|nr:zf-DHHC-domain-containing protein [Ramaria rubella]